MGLFGYKKNSEILGNSSHFVTASKFKNNNNNEIDLLPR